MNVLAIDTASPEPGVALILGGRLSEVRVSGDRRCSEELLPAVAAVLADSGGDLGEVERIAVCAGPGSFTGLRIGLATAWGLGRALGISIESVSTLDALAEAARGAGHSRLHAALDAGRAEIVAREFSLDRARARPVGPVVRLPRSEAATSLAGPIVVLPAALFGDRGTAPTTALASALALAVDREPGAATSASPAAIYARPSAAEEKHGSP